MVSGGVYWVVEILLGGEREWEKFLLEGGDFPDPPSRENPGSNDKIWKPHSLLSETAVTT